MNSSSVYIESVLWSCEDNLVGCSMIYRYLIENGHRISNTPNEADFIIINSCGVVKDVVDKFLELYDKYESIKKKNGKIIIFGCLVKIDKDLINSLNAISISFDESYKLDEFFYTKSKFETIMPYCDDETKLKLTLGKTQFDIFENIPFASRLFSLVSKKFESNYDHMIKNITYRDKTFISIARGCLGNCNYCMIKKAKGSVRSRKIIDILTDIKRYKNESKNIYLVADDCGCYGLDIGTNLFDLLYRIDKEFPNISIDLNNLNPNWLENSTTEYIKLFKEIEINFVKIPLQSGSDKIISLMNRRYDIKKVQNIILQIKNVSPSTLIMTHFIIGYPGENSTDFIKSIHASRYFDYPLPIKYSKNKGTISSTLSNQKSDFVISLRYNIFLLYLNVYLLIRLLTSPKLKK